MVTRVCETLCECEAATVQLWVDGDTGAALFRGLPAGVQGVYPQQGATLGERMAAICESGFRQGYRKVILVGSDAPTLSTAHIREVVRQLDDHDAVIVPALDGGYVLLGLTRQIDSLFEDMPWGGNRVLSLSVQRLRAAGARYALLEAVPDIDRPEDLRHLPDDLVPGDSR
jgi:rSAM/selenodomain-associated transferase 1